MCELYQLVGWQRGCGVAWLSALLRCVGGLCVCGGVGGCAWLSAGRLGLSWLAGCACAVCVCSCARVRSYVAVRVTVSA